MEQGPQITRRDVCRIGIAAGLVLAGQPVRAAEEPKADTFFDIHTHLGQVWNHSRPLSAKELLEWMDQHQIERAAVLPLVSPEASSFLLTSDFVLMETEPHRDRLIPFCCIDPRTSYSGGRHGLRDMIRRYVDRGARGFGEHKPGLPIDDPRSQEIYAVCGELKLPLLFHLDEQRNTDAPGLPGLEKMLKDFPETRFVGHGPGWWASIAGDVKQAELGGYPSGAVAPGGAMDALMEKYPNLYGDLSAGSGAGALSRDMEFARAFLVRRADRLLFGTDYLSPGQQVPQLALFQQIELPAEARAAIYRGNAMRLLQLEE